jgi:hypothetical protein
LQEKKTKNRAMATAFAEKSTEQLIYLDFFRGMV